MSDAHQVRILEGQSFACGTDERVLLAMERCGAKDIKVGCRGGGCGVCRVRVVQGSYRTGKMSATHVSDSDRKEGIALACRLFPESDLVISVEQPR